MTPFEATPVYWPLCCWWTFGLFSVWGCLNRTARNIKDRMRSCVYINRHWCWVSRWEGFAGSRGACIYNPTSISRCFPESDCFTFFYSLIGSVCELLLLHILASSRLSNLHFSQYHCDFDFSFPDYFMRFSTIFYIYWLLAIGIFLWSSWFSPVFIKAYLRDVESLFRSLC